MVTHALCSYPNHCIMLHQLDNIVVWLKLPAIIFIVVTHWSVVTKGMPGIGGRQINTLKHLSE